MITDEGVDSINVDLNKRKEKLEKKVLIHLTHGLKKGQNK